MGGRWSAEMSAVGERVSELRQIVGELAKSQAQAAIIDAAQGARLETLAKRLDEIVARLDRVDARKP
jgi:division protein CdvB (Snf7/Vps24/ESCRT-III family)